MVIYVLRYGNILRYTNSKSQDEILIAISKTLLNKLHMF